MWIGPPPKLWHYSCSTACSCPPMKERVKESALHTVHSSALLLSSPSFVSETANATTTTVTITVTKRQRQLSRPASTGSDQQNQSSLLLLMLQLKSFQSRLKSEPPSLSVSLSDYITWPNMNRVEEEECARRAPSKAVRVRTRPDFLFLAVSTRFFPFSCWSSLKFHGSFHLDRSATH